jgi:hypothetical protein
VKRDGQRKVVGGGGSWRQLLRSRIDRDRLELKHSTYNKHPARATEIHKLLDRVEAVVSQPGSPAGWLSGASQDRAWLSIHEAEAQIDELLEPAERRAHAQDLLVKASTVLPPDDPRVREVAAGLAKPAAGTARPAPDPAAVAHLARAVNDASDERYAQSRTFRNRLIRLSGMSLGVLVLLLAAFASNSIPIEVSNDPAASYFRTAMLVSLFGAVGALITAVHPLSRVTGTWNPFSLPLYQMLLKVALGPTFAIIGVMMLQAGVIPNVAFPMPLADLLVWALVFGAAQHVVTRFIDSRVAGLVSSEPSERTAPGKPGAAERPRPSGHGDEPPATR